MGPSEARGFSLPTMQRASPVFGTLQSPGFIVNLFLDDAVDTLPTSNTLGFLSPYPCWLSPSFHIPFLQMVPLISLPHSSITSQRFHAGHLDIFECIFTVS